MNTKSQFKKSYKYYLKHVNTSTYFEAQKKYDEKHKKEILEFEKNDPELKNRTDWYENHIVTSVTICDILSNDGITKLSKRLYSLSPPKYKTTITYKKPSVFKNYDYVHLQYSGSFYGIFAEVEFLDDKYINSVKITWSQINSYFAILEYKFTLKHNLSEENCTRFICDNIKKLNKKDYLPYYFISNMEVIDFHILNEMNEDFFVLIFQHYITSTFYSEQGQKYRLINMVHMTRKEPINIDTLDFGYCGVSYYNKKENYMIICDSNYNYCLMAGNNNIPQFSLSSYIAKYGNSFYYMFFGHRELKIFEIEFSKYSTGRKKAKYNKKFTYLLNKMQSLCESQAKSKSDIYQSFDKDWKLYLGYKEQKLNKFVAKIYIDYKSIYANHYAYLNTLCNINYTKSNQFISIAAIIIAIITLILTA
jgi:hypothetical protein